MPNWKKPIEREYVEGAPKMRIIPGILYCENCSAEVEIDPRNFTTTCRRCGADYNGSGQRLAPRGQWGEETGEHWTECY